jgi:hypothetical protein
LQNTVLRTETGEQLPLASAPPLDTCAVAPLCALLFGSAWGASGAVESSKQAAAAKHCASPSLPPLTRAGGRAARSGKTVEEVWQLIHGSGARGGRGLETQSSLAGVTLGSFLQSAGLSSLAFDLPDVPELQVRPELCRVRPYPGQPGALLCRGCREPQAPAPALQPVEPMHGAGASPGARQGGGCTGCWCVGPGVRRWPGLEPRCLLRS